MVEPPSGLFDDPLSLLDWLPGESLFSLASRQHAFWGHTNSGETATILFGHRHGGTHHDFPSALEDFVFRTSGRFGQSEDLALNRTLLSYYRPYASQAVIAECLQTMQSKSVRHLKFRLGLLTSRFRANHPLKACPVCMAKDDSDHGWAYWHLVHQYPGAWLCERHGQPLFESTVKSTGVDRFSWVLPNMNGLSLKWLSDKTDIFALTKLSSLTLAFARENRGTGWLDGAFVVPVLREALRQRGWMTTGGSVRTAEAAVSYLAWCQCLQGPDELSALPTNAVEAAAQIGRICRTWRTGTHPLRILVAITWLFEDADAFLATYDRLHQSEDYSLTTQVEGNANSCRSQPAKENSSQQLVALFKSGYSATAAAKQLGVDVGTAMAWAAQAGIAVPRRPKSLKLEIQSALKRDLVLGVDKTVAALTHGVSVQAVTRYLRTEPGLHGLWQGAVFRNRQEVARASWIAILATQGHFGVLWLRQVEGAAYTWLYRHDRVWLQSHLPDKVQRISTMPRIAWDERDLILSTAVDQAIGRLQALQPDKALRLWQIYQAVPQLKPKLSALSRLPLTQRAIARGLGRPKPSTTKPLF
jgi:hypothetical protein